MTQRILTALLILTALFWTAGTAQDNERPEFDGDSNYPTPTAEDLKVKNAVDEGLAHLASIQNNDGSWSNDVGNKLGERYDRNPDGLGKPHLGVTAIAGMAFIASGHTPNRGEYRRNVAAGLAFIMSNIDRDTGWITRHDTRMYSHAFCAMFLAEVYGQTRDPVVLSSLRNAIRFIVQSQNKEGAWRYVPNQHDSDMSICVCQLQALRAASNVGVDVPDKAIESARDYVRQSYNDARYRYGTRGTFSYQVDNDTRSTFSLTAAGVVALQSLGEYDSHRFVTSEGEERILDLNASIRYIKASRPDSERVSSFLMPQTSNRLCNYGFWYGHYYAAQAMHQYQYTSKRTWEEWNEMNRDHFLKLQHSNGAWTDEIGGWDPETNAFATAMACLVLSIPRGYLPIFQS